MKLNKYYDYFNEKDKENKNLKYYNTLIVNQF